MKKRLLFIYLIIGCLLLPALSLKAAGLSVVPDQLSFQLLVHQKATQELLLKNISQGPVIYNLYMEELGEQITLEPDFLRLEGGESAKVKVTVKPKKTGVYLTNLVVIAQDLDRREFNAQAGARLPLQLQVLPTQGLPFSEIIFWVIITIDSLMILLVIFLVVEQKKRVSFWQKVLRFLKKIGRIN